MASEETAKFTATNLLNIAKNADIQLALGVVGIIFIMVIPLPPFLLDFFLVLSISSSLMMLLISLYIKEPLEFSTFPTLLLITTLFRLGLNVATTRSILLDGASGQVSSVVSAFGNFVVGGNYFVGGVIFVILVIINFIVITKGAGRVAEVGARFTLDAMPGKQMSIDADLNGGLIDKEEAKRRRQKIEREADFYGSMDGASKFVRGDAIAGLIITTINIIVGLLLGAFFHNMTFGKSAEIFTILTVGDGLVSQIPALIISVSSGIIVTRNSGQKNLSADLSDQFFVHPKAAVICSFLMFVFGLVPGLPSIPFFTLGIGCFILSRYSNKFVAQKELEKKLETETVIQKEGSRDSVEALLHLDTLSLEVGVALIPFVDTQQDGEVLERVVSARKQFAQEMGIIVPMVMVRDNIQLKPGDYQILLKGNPVGKGSLMSDYFLAMDSGDIMDPIDGIRTKEPAYGLDAIWIRPSQKEEATFRGYTVVNCATIVVTHLTKIISDYSPELLGRQEVQHLIEGLRDEFPKLVEEVIASDRLTLGDVVKVLQNLLAEGVSIRDMHTIFETLADHARVIRHPDSLTRYVRRSLGRGIVRKYLSHDGKLIVATLDRAVEDLLISGLQQMEDGSTSLSLEPELAQKLLQSIAKTMKKFDESATLPILLCGSRVRWDLYKLVNRFIPGLIVLAFDEVPSGTETETIGFIQI